MLALESGGGDGGFKVGDTNLKDVGVVGVVGLEGRNASCEIR